jgi:glycosyltransferase involved in cell wall biosynthesis
MKITIATGPLLPVPAVKGGAVQKLWHGLAIEFARQGHAVTIVARSFSGQPETEIRDGINFIRVGGFDQSLSVRRDLVKNFFDSARVTRHLPQADILVTNDFWLPFFAGWLRPSAGKIVVNVGRFPKGQFGLYRRAARIAAVSVAVKNAVVAQCPALATRTCVLPNPVDTTLLKPAVKDNRAKRTLLFVGRLHPEKGVHLLVKAFAAFVKTNPSWRLQLVGPVDTGHGGGGENYRRQLESLSAGLPVEFFGSVFDPAKLAAIYQQAELFCYPSLAEFGESFGVAPLEAMACGVPAVVSSLECFRDFITDDVNGFFFDHRGQNPAAQLTLQLQKAVSTTDNLTRMGQQAAATAQLFSYPAVARKYLNDFAVLTKH